MEWAQMESSRLGPATLQSGKVCRLGMGELPIKFASLRIQWTRRNDTTADPADRNHFRIVSAGKDFIRFLKVLIGKGFLDHRHVGITQQPDHPLPGNAREKRPVWYGCKHHAVPSHEDVGGGQLSNIAQHVAHHSIVKTASVRLE